MTQARLTIPVSVEQIAIAIQQMSLEDQRRLLALVPNLVKIAQGLSIQLPGQTQEPVQELDPLAELRAQVLAALGNRPLSPDEPFLGGLTIAQYDALTEQEKNELWDHLAGIDLMDIEEIEVNVDAVPA